MGCFHAVIAIRFFPYNLLTAQGLDDFAGLHLTGDAMPGAGGAFALQGARFSLGLRGLGVFRV